MSVKSYLAVLKNINFTKLWISQLTSQLTNYILTFTILIKVFRLTNSSASVSIVVLAFGLATLFFGSLAGVYSDRFDRKGLLTIINFAQAGSIGLYFLIGADFWSLVLITFLYSSFNQFYIPAEAPSIPNLVPQHQLLLANGYFTFTGSAALIIGFASAGPLAIAFGESAPYLVAVILLSIAGLACFFLPALLPEKKPEPHEIFRLWEEFKEGILHFWNNKKLHYPLISLVSVQMINGMMITISPAYIERAIGIHLESSSLAVVIPLGLGILFGVLGLGFEEHYFTKKSLIFAGFMGMGIALAMLSLINYFDHKYLYYFAVALFMGFFNAHILAPSHSMLQVEALSHMRGRIYGSLYVMLQTAATVPTVIVGILADRIDVAMVMGGLGVLLIILGVLNRPREDVVAPI